MAPHHLTIALIVTVSSAIGMRVDPTTLITVPIASAPAPEGYWRGGYHVPGVSGHVETTALYGADLLLGGAFEAIGAERYCALARWDGASFHPLGRTDGLVWALVPYRAETVAVGRFDSVDDVAARNVAAWNGSTWRPLGGGTDGVVQSAGMFRDQLIVGGSFFHAGDLSASSIAAWDGASWNPLGAGTGRGVLALQEYQDQLFVGGRFVTAGGMSALRIARWDGVSWSAVGANGTVQALHVWNGMLIAGGDFTVIGGVAADHIASWDGTTWRPLGAGADGGVDTLATYRGSLVAAGRFVSAGGVAAERIASWDGSTWRAFGAGIGSHAPIVGSSQTVAALVEYRGELIAGGSFGEAGGTVAPNFARWDGDRWRAFSDPGGLGAATVISGVTAHAGGIVAMGVDFLYAGETRVRRTARWDGRAWEDLDSPFERPVALGTFQNDLVQAGHVDSADGALRVARRRGGAWQVFGAPFESPTGAFVEALCEWNGRMLVGGGFASVGDRPIRHLAAWNGLDFASLGADPPGPVRAILALRDGGLVIGGSTEASPSQAYVARWDGVGWQLLGGPFMGLTPGHTSAISALAEYRGQIVSAGQFLSVDGDPIANIAVWNGTRWHDLGGGVAGSEPSGVGVSALAVFRGRLVAAGTFATAGSVEAEGIAAWSGRAWSRLGPLGGGCGATVPFFLSLASARGSLFASGRLTLVGGTVSVGIAEWVGSR
jgi:hypothetical protein